jgi:hypothetical protein
VVLTAVPGDKAGLSGWSSSCSSAGAALTCTRVANADVSTTATFVRQTVKFTVATSGTGSVAATIDGAPCDAVCLAAVPKGATVTLTAVPGTNARFSSWSSSCAQPVGATPDPVCRLVADVDRWTTASFAATAYTVRVNKNKTGSGTVTLSSGGVSCGLGCDTTGEVAIAVGQPVTITATPAPGWKVSWGKACPTPATATETSCTVTGNWAVTVTFAPI